MAEAQKFMKLRFLWSLLAATLFLSEYLVIQPSQANQPVQTHRSTWSKFTLKQARFSVLMPGTPKQVRQIFKTQLGTIDFHAFAVEQHGGTVGYLVGYLDFPVNSALKANPNQALEIFARGFVKGTQGNLVSQRSLRMQGYPGKEFTLEKRSFFVKGRMYLVNRRLYLVMVQTTKEQEKNLSRTNAGFLNSFKLLLR
ncbi:MAG: hypothetical protein NVS2B14_09740 [Chamaesiphon sp.]